ncbi:arylphorin subunit alpha-like [Pararge aegeria]|uniref:Jg3421 protein n=1 Tax=Pararge aegeria aegeria TaxID=348720 RepID=A0A8S4RNX7_9NEOP|nr:arylphorin subunit alpha-like [Pararge aegeria]CAH2239993.1 jg3421 [Pararge aegeria aegeria]
MFIKYLTVMFLWLFFLGNVISSPAAGEFRSLVDEGEFTLKDEAHVKFIVPGSYSSQKSQNQTIPELDDLIDKDNEHYYILSQHIEAGHTMKGLTFTIYDDNMREAAIALFRILQNVDENKINIIKEWAYERINKDILEYALRLGSLHRGDDAIDALAPPFVTKPNFFVNSETIQKALYLKVNNGKIDPQEEQIYQIFREQDLVIINANYSGWNQWNEDCKDNLDYFRQDIGLNSYYYGVHLLYPFWMSNNELSAIDPKYAEKYYYIHRYLIARYSLEKEHLKQKNISTDSNCYDDFIPYLSYDNGLPFSRRSSVRVEFNEEYTRIKTIDIAIKECIARDVMFMENGTKVDLTEDNYVDLLTKLIRANFESIETAKSIRELLGYGGIDYPSDRYNPAPSVLHHPQTALRDPMYWYLVQGLLKYFTEYSSTLEPYDFSKYQSEDIDIIHHSISKITTYYDYYQISLNNVFKNNDPEITDVIYTARQKRIKHLPFSFAFTVSSKVNKTALVKLFIGPRCQSVNCWDKYSQFYELDTFTQELGEGLNLVKWSSESSAKYSIDDYFNIESTTSRNNRFDMLRFPENLIIPKGLNEGLQLTLFILIVPENAYYKAPLGFPFHREVLINSTDCNNYKFYNISIFHKENTREMEGYYSPHLN